MRIELNQTVDDLTSFYQYVLWYSDEKKYFRVKTRILAGFITALPFLLFISFNNNSNIEIPSKIGLIVAFLFFFSGGFLFAKSSVLGKARNIAAKIKSESINSDLFGHKVIEFSLDKIKWESENGHGESKITSIKKIKSDGIYYYLFIDTISAYVIPKSVFLSNSQEEEFLKIVNSHLL